MKKALSITAIILIAIAGFLLAGCNKENLQDANTIKYGTSFGMCVGNCYNELTVTPNKLSISRISTTAKDPKVCTQSFNNEQWQQLRDKIDIKKFKALNTVYGCPDCADGGAEWIEIQQGETKHRVTFEYHNEPEAVKAYISLLREHTASFKDCK